jgi:DNA repair protein RadA/Sms
MKTELFENSLELALLATALYESDAESGIDALFGQIEPKHFYRPQHRALYEAALNLRLRNMPLNEIFIKQELREKYDENIHLDVLASTPLPAPLPYCLQLVELYRLRELESLTTEIRRLINDGADSSETITELRKKLDEIEKHGAENTAAKSYDQWAIEDSQKPALVKYDLGVSFLNDTFRGGWEAGQLILIGGDPESGKTMLATQVMKHIAKTTQVVFFCFEFTVRKFVQLQKEIEGEAYSLPNLQIIDEGYDIAQIERETRLWAKKGAKVIVIDSQMRIENVADKNGTVEERETAKFSRLAKLAHRLELVIILIIQTSKQDTSTGVVAPSKSKNGAHEASVILYLKQIPDKKGEEGVNRHKRKLYLYKNKQNGIHFITEINFNPVKKIFTRTYEQSYQYKDKTIPIEVVGI